jgi:serine/threonine-protein kinase HipA
MTSLDMRILRVLLYRKPIGTLTYLPGKKNLFSFDENYIQDLSRPALSLSFKNIYGDLITNTYTAHTRLPPFFSNLLPEGPLRDYLAERGNINPQHEFFLLWMLGQDLPGALTIQAIDGDLFPFQWDGIKLRSQKTKEVPFRFSLAGVQLKFSAIAKADHGFVIPANGVGGNWIVKLPHSVFREVPENEYTMMELARRVGIDVPETALYPIEQLEGLPPEFEHLGKHVFAIKRFDRTEEGEMIHIEDFAQVFGIYPEKKYEGVNYKNIAMVLQKEAGGASVLEFIRRFVFNALIGNGDMHLKNWSLIYKDKHKPSLAPAYDFVSTLPYLPKDQLALNFIDSKEFSSLTLKQFKRFALKAHLSEKLVLDTVQETVQLFSDAWKKVKDLPLRKDVHEAISKHLREVPLWHSID